MVGLPARLPAAVLMAEAHKHGAVTESHHIDVRVSHYQAQLRALLGQAPVQRLQVVGKTQAGWHRVKIIWRRRDISVAHTVSKSPFPVR